MSFHTGHTITCCKDCPNRFPGCHSTCEKYIQQKNEYEKAKAERKAKSAVQQGLNEYKFDFGHRVTKRQVYRSKYRKGR